MDPANPETERRWAAQPGEKSPDCQKGIISTGLVKFRGELVLEGTRICPFIHTWQIKGIWVVIICGFMSLFYIILQVNIGSITKSFALFEIASGKRENSYFVSDEIVLKRLDNVISGTNNSRLDYSNKDIGKLHKSEKKIGILIPSTTRKIKSPVLEKLSLTRLCLPSIYSTIEPKFKYVIYIGIDKGDYLETVNGKLETKFDNVKVVVSPGRTFTKSVNAIAREAYRDGMDYLVRTNDDSSMETKNWTSIGISVLQNYNPPNIGVVGPTCRQGNTAILTHDMVHRTHLEIFDFYYPPYFDNWWSDNWITKVYSPERSTKLHSWVVKHHLKSHGTRYKVDGRKSLRLNKTVTFDRERLAEYLSSLRR